MGNLLRVVEIRALSSIERVERLKELQKDLMHERGVAAMGGSPPSPGKIRALRRQIARLKTIINEEVKTSG